MAAHPFTALQGGLAAALGKGGRGRAADVAGPWPCTSNRACPSVAGCQAGTGQAALRLSASVGYSGFGSSNAGSNGMGRSNSSNCSSSSSNGVATRVAVHEASTNAAWKDEVLEPQSGKHLEKQPKEPSTDITTAEAGPEPPSPFEVQSLLMELCDETSIAELSIKVGSFQLHVKRGSSVSGSKTTAPAQFFPPPVPSFPMADTLAATEPPPQKAPASPSAPSSGSADVDLDEGLLYVTAPTVGVLRLARIAKGKRGRNLVEKGGPVKSGQVVCYVEQLGTQLAVESEHTGEVVNFLFEDGDAVGFGDQLVSIRPSFPGIK